MFKIPEELKEFLDWRETADHFWVEFSSPHIMGCTSALYNPKEQIYIHTGRDGNTHISTDTQSVPKFIIDLIFEGSKLVSEIEMAVERHDLEDYGKFTFTKEDGTIVVYRFYRKPKKE